MWSGASRNGDGGRCAETSVEASQVGRRRARIPVHHRQTVEQSNRSARGTTDNRGTDSAPQTIGGQTARTAVVAATRGMQHVKGGRLESSGEHWPATM